MRSSWQVVLMASSLVMAPSASLAGSGAEGQASSSTMRLEIEAQQPAIDDVRIAYESHGHEHVSHGPDEAFAAVEGVHVFRLSDEVSSERVTLRWDALQRRSEPVQWKRYAITLLEVSDDQGTVVVQLVRDKAE